ncbi:MAG: YafY family transcriptional regulator [Nitrospinae bacterium]|nr:YafY family transcriptional regulator [Nitrospinota bacterium]
MRRADRLFMIVQLLRSGRVVTAAKVAERLEVSERTVYRDIRDLTLSGVPIEGEAGVGYTIRNGYDLPPLMFNEEEIAALIIGARMVEAWGGMAHGRGAAMALSKIQSVLPAHLSNSLEQTKVFSLSFPERHDLRKMLDVLHSAINGSQRVALRYSDEKGAGSRRVIRPLGLYFWGKVWTLAAWCELRKDFRTFRVDRILSATVRKEVFKDEKGKTLEDFLKRAWVE